MTTFATSCVANKFNILAKEEEEEEKEESNTKNDADDLPGNSHFTSRGPRVCIIRFKKFTMSGRTKEGLDDDRKKTKKTGNEKEVEEPSKRIYRRCKRLFKKKGSKNHRKQPKSSRTIRKKFFQTQQIKVDFMYHQPKVFNCFCISFQCLNLFH